MLLSKTLTSTPEVQFWINNHLGSLYFLLTSEILRMQISFIVNLFSFAIP